MKKQKTVNAVWCSGKDGYHFSKMKTEHSEKEIIMAMQETILIRNPSMSVSDSFSAASHAYNYLEDQVVGQGVCRQAREGLAESISTESLTLA